MSDGIPNGFTGKQWAAVQAAVDSGDFGAVQAAVEGEAAETTHGEQPHTVHCEGSEAVVVGCADTSVTVVSGREMALAQLFGTMWAESRYDFDPEEGEDGRVRECARLTKLAAGEMGITTHRQIGPSVEVMET